MNQPIPNPAEVASTEGLIKVQMNGDGDICFVDGPHLAARMKDGWVPVEGQQIDPTWLPDYVSSDTAPEDDRSDETTELRGQLEETSEQLQEATGQLEEAKATADQAGRQVQIVRALAGLDHSIDDHWTKSGDPAISVVEKAAGFDVTRDEITAAFPGFTRQKPTEPPAS